MFYSSFFVASSSIQKFIKNIQKYFRVSKASIKLHLKTCSFDNGIFLHIKMP